MTRPGVVLGLAVALAVAGPGAAGCGSAPRARSLILVSIDTLRADHLGLYGYERETTPHLDDLAAESIVFERAVAHAPNTAPSHASMLTSLYPGRHGFTGDDDRLADRHVTLAELARDAGLHTAAFTDGGYLSAAFGFDQGFELYDDSGGGLAAIAPRAEAWLAAHADEPFFVFVHCYDVHSPYDPPEPYHDLFHERPYRGRFEPTTENLLAAAFRARKPDAEDLRHVVARYDEGIRYVDQVLAGFLARLRHAGLLEHTAVAITSDHGEEFGEHGSFTHWQLYYEPLLHVPLLLRLPGGAHGGRRIETPVQLVDLLPSALDLLGLPAHPAAEGVSLLPLVAHGDPPAGDPLWERPAPAWPPDPARMRIRALIAGRYQLRFHGPADLSVELFDLEADPLSRTNLALREPERTRQLLAVGSEILRANQPTATQPLEIEPALREKLRALGYLDASP